MNKEDLIKKISKDSKIKIKKTSKIFNRTIDLISKEIKKKRVITIDGFGEFQIRRHEMKILQHKNNTNVVIPPKDVIEFVTSPKLNHYLNSDG